MGRRGLAFRGKILSDGFSSISNIKMIDSAIEHGQRSLGLVIRHQVARVPDASETKITFDNISIRLVGFY